jgi:hypothetical protein
VSARNKWNKEGSWHGFLTVGPPLVPVKPPEFHIGRGGALAQSAGGRTSTGTLQVSLLCFLEVEDRMLEPSFKWFMRRLPREIRVLDVATQQNGFLAEVVLLAEKRTLAAKNASYYLGKKPLQKGLPIVLEDNKNFRIHGVILGDPVPLKRADG